MSGFGAFGRILAHASDAPAPGVDPDDAHTVVAALERARVVGVLDAWADEGGDWARAWESCRRPGSFWVVLTDGGTRCFHGDSPDAARAAAAKAAGAHYCEVSF